MSSHICSLDFFVLLSPMVLLLCLPTGQPFSYFFTSLVSIHTSIPAVSEAAFWSLILHTFLVVKEREFCNFFPSEHTQINSPDIYSVTFPLFTHCSLRCCFSIPTKMKWICILVIPYLVKLNKQPQLFWGTTDLYVVKSQMNGKESSWKLICSLHMWYWIACMKKPLY